MIKGRDIVVQTTISKFQSNKLMKEMSSCKTCFLKFSENEETFFVKDLFAKAFCLKELPGTTT